MCGPRSSSKWVTEWSDLEVKTHEISNEDLKLLRNQNWYKDENAIKLVLDQAEHLKILHFAGGEPLIIPAMHKLLAQLAERGHAQNIILTYNTKATQS